MTPTVEVSQYTVSLLPRGHREYRHFLVRVERVLSRQGQVQWEVRNSFWTLSHAGTWDDPPYERTAVWLSTHRWLDREDALNEAREAVRRIEVNGIPVAAVLARGAS